jgi:hypothetical protein
MKTEKIIDELLKSKFLSPEKFALDIEQMVHSEHCDYIEAIVHYCEQNNIELETVPKLLSKPLKEKIKHNATLLNFLKKTTKTKMVI